MVALVVVGVGLRVGLLEGPAPFAITVVPAIFGARRDRGRSALMALVPTDFERRLRDWALRATTTRGWRGSAQRLATLPAAVSAGRARGDRATCASGDPALLGALAFWGFNIGVLWACVPRVRRGAAAGR